MNNDPAALKGLLRHCAETNDDTPRLVLADWLEDRGDFRAEFVRAGVAYERTPPYDFTRFQLAERLRGLLETPGFKEWLPASPAFKWGWRRGLLTLIADTEQLQDEVTSGRVRNTRRISRWLASDWIERVEFDGYTRSMPIWEDTFGLVRNTRELYFATDDYGPSVRTRLREWPHLRGLGLPYFGPPWADLAALPHLRALKLDNPDWTMMPELPETKLPNLEVLDLDKEWEGDLPHWGSCFPKLRSLKLTQWNAYPDEQCERFAECCHLRHLGFHQRYKPLTRVGLKALAKLKDLRSLTLGPLPRGTIAGLAELSKLERLAIEGEAKLIRGLESLAQLRWLSLEVKSLTGEMAEQVAGLPQLARLEIYLRNFEAGAIAALAKAPALRVLSVSVPQGNNPPTAELVRLELLRYLWLGNGKPTQPEVLSLQAALPDCRIITPEQVRCAWDNGRLHADTGDDAYDWC